MKKIIIISTFSFSTLVALVMVLALVGSGKRTVASTSLNAAYGKSLDSEAAFSPQDIDVQPAEMAASKIKETLLTELQESPTRLNNEKFFFEYNPCSPKLLACLLMATKKHIAARKLLEGNGKLDLEQLQALRNHEVTRDVMSELEVLEGQPMGNVIQKLVEIVKKLDVQPKESDVDERIREIALTLKHIVIVPDGDRRWAKERGLLPIEGHKKAIVNIPILFEELWKFGFHTTTLSLFSTETWNRSKAEIEWLMDVFHQLLVNIVPLAKQYHVKIIHLGRKDRLPKFLLKTIQQLELCTSSFKKHVFNVGIDYGAKDEVTRACKKLIEQGLSVNDITEEKLTAAMDTAQQSYPNPDFFIRTGKETRTSGFMSFQMGYSELYFAKKYFPDFDIPSLKEALLDFGYRTRRLGK